MAPAGNSIRRQDEETTIGRYHDGRKPAGPSMEAQEKSGVIEMALTRDFRDTIRERAQRDAGFRRALLQEALQHASRRRGPQ